MCIKYISDKQQCPTQNLHNNSNTVTDLSDNQNLRVVSEHSPEEDYKHLMLSHKLKDGGTKASVPSWHSVFYSQNKTPATSK
jgi:hypothetical protein